MIKTILSGSFDFNDAVAQIVPLHKAGLDHGWMHKRAAAQVFDFSKLAGKKDETLVHLLALGDGESIGCNRNGDFFPTAANEKYHHTFLKANYFHNHDNKDPKKSFGRVVSSAHNAPMGRVELVIAIDNNKGAKDLDELEKKGEFPVSMSCSVPLDICCICGNKARTRRDYCKHASQQMGQIFADGKQAYVINDYPNFFDISKVYRGADRVAFTFRQLNKAASEGRTLGGAELAELLNVIDTHVPIVKSAFYLRKKAVLRDMVTNSSSETAKFLSAFAACDAPNSTINTLKECSDSKAVFSTLHSAGVCLALGDFLKVAGISKPDDVNDGDITHQICEIMSDMRGPRAERICGNGTYDMTTDRLNNKVATAVRALRVDFSLFSEFAYKRIMKKVSSCGLPAPLFSKSAGAVSPQASVLADEYLSYLVSFASSSDDGFVRNLTSIRAFV